MVVTSCVENATQAVLDPANASNPNWIMTRSAQQTLNDKEEEDKDSFETGRDIIEGSEGDNSYSTTGGGDFHIRNKGI